MRRSLKVHLPLALLSGLTAFVVLNLAAWYNLRDSPNVCRRQYYTGIFLQKFAHDIRLYRKEHDELPARLSALPDQSEQTLKDEWENPIQYEISGEEFTVFSFGRDGKPGGVGLNADLYHDDRNAEKSLPTLRQFFLTGDSAEVDNGGFVMTGLFIGGFVAFTVFGSLRDLEKRVNAPSPWLLVASVVVTLVLACAIGYVLLHLHIPTGH